MTNLCDVCGKPATQSMLRDLFGKSDEMRFVCSDHGFRIRDPADVAEIERLRAENVLQWQNVQELLAENAKLQGASHEPGACAYIGAPQGKPNPCILSAAHSGPHKHAQGASRDASSLHEKNIAKFNALKSGEGQ